MCSLCQRFNPLDQPTNTIAQSLVCQFLGRQRLEGGSKAFTHFGPVRNFFQRLKRIKMYPDSKENIAAFRQFAQGLMLDPEIRALVQMHVFQYARPSCQHETTGRRNKSTS